MTRAVLILNPEATTVTPRVRDVIAHALDDVVSLEVAETKRRDHATELAREAVAGGKEIVFCLGGDGTLNETINGLAGSEVALAVLPGGGTNVFARTMGLPRDPIEATAIVIERIREGSEPRRVSLGTLNGRRFAFCAGIGFDAEVVREVHRKFASKQRWGEPFFVTTAVRTFFTSSQRRRTSLTVSFPDGRVSHNAALAVVAKSDPYTFLGRRPFRLVPHARAEDDLDVTMVRSLSLVTTLRIVFGGFRGGRHLRMRRVEYRQNVEGLTVSCETAQPVQADGEYLGEMREIRFGVERNALRVL